MRIPEWTKCALYALDPIARDAAATRMQNGPLGPSASESNPRSQICRIKMETMELEIVM